MGRNGHRDCTVTTRCSPGRYGPSVPGGPRPAGTPAPAPRWWRRPLGLRHRRNPGTASGPQCQDAGRELEAAQDRPQCRGRLDHAVENTGHPPARNASASSMQSPASADATRLIILLPVLPRPGVLPGMRRWSMSSLRIRCRARVAGRRRPALATRRGRKSRPGCGGGGCASASIGCSFTGTVLLLQDHCPGFRGASSCHFRPPTRRPPSADSAWIGEIIEPPWL